MSVRRFCLLNEKRVKLLPRKPADLRISFKRRDGKTHRIKLIRQDVGGRFWVRRCVSRKALAAGSW